MTKDQEKSVVNEEEQSAETEMNDLQTETASEGQEEQETNEVPPSKVDQWKAQAEENYQRFLRAQADFDNFRRRSRQEREESAKYASLKVVESLLPALDNFERALSANKETASVESLIQGVDMVLRQMKQALEQEGLQPMNVVGEPFNPEFHQAVMQVESDEHESGIVVEELQKGYLLKDKVIRPAMVKVAE